MYLCIHFGYYNILTLREPHHEHHVNGNEPQQVSHHHPIDHHHERPDGFETPAEKKLVLNVLHSFIQWRSQNHEIEEGFSINETKLFTFNVYKLYK